MIKLGKQEAEGRGLAPNLAEALDRGLPALVRVKWLNLPQFRASADGLPQPMLADPATIRDWRRFSGPRRLLGPKSRAHDTRGPCLGRCPQQQRKPRVEPSP